MKRAAIIGLAVVVLLVGAFAGYGWWTRRGEPAFSKGGTFGAPSVTASPTATVSKKASSKPKTSKRTRTEAAGATKSGSGSATTSAAGSGSSVVVRAPAEGRYVYEATGSERVRFGSASPCSWDVEQVSVDVRKDGKDHVFDRDYADEHQERRIERFADDGVTISYLGVAITCLGVRETTEDDYEPDATVLELPLKVGAEWNGVSRTQNRREEIEGTILKRETITVPAGRFVTYKVRTKVYVSDGQSGEATLTNWFAPSLGISVKEVAHTEAQDGDASFVSDYTMELAQTP